MILKTIRLVVLCVLCMYCGKVSAQEDYLLEIGAAGGTAYYLGDANDQLFKNMQATYGIYTRYRVNTRIAVKAEIGRAKIIWDGNSTGNQVNAFDFTGEFNFFDLEQNLNKRQSKLFTPYIFAGIGAMDYSYIGGNQINTSIPFGVGFKLKLDNRWNVSAQWTTRILMSDKMEGIAELNDTYNLNGTNFTNNDILSTFTIGIGYDIWERPCDCKVVKDKKKHYKFKL